MFTIDSERSVGGELLRMPNGRVGLSLGTFGISASELVCVNQADVKKDGNTGGRERDLDNPGVLADLDAPSIISISHYQETGRIGIGSLKVDSPVPPRLQAKLEETIMGIFPLATTPFNHTIIPNCCKERVPLLRIIS